MSDKGWIKIHRKLYDNPYASDPHWVALWCYFLCKASRGGKEVLWKGKRYKLQPGQFTAGYNQMAKETGINREKIRRVVALFKSDTQITHQTSSACSLFTVLKWDEYQTVTPNVTLKRHSNDTLVTPKQEGENKRIEEVIESVLKFECSGNPSEWHLTQGQIDEWADAYPSVDILAECKRAKAWTDANTKKTHRGMKRFLVNWLSQSVNRNTFVKKPDTKPRE